ncbi:hypothetical protein EOM39_03865 [Candidatus Gracilibacteria bacterium]|nr:hypothetical protein [Candidatus Gracilibacteria bacterium]
MFAFELGREYRLSIAEIYALFPEMEIIYVDEKILLVDNINEDGLIKITPKMGGTIKIIKCLSDKSYDLSEINDLMISLFTDERKTNYAVNFYGKTKANQKDFLLKSKKYFAKSGLSTRFVNQDFQNIKSYLVAKEKLIETKTDFNIFFTPLDTFVGSTIFVQDIDSYAKRDFGKTRDMQVGMLPPKLAQMMINIGGGKSIYDPFCGLGTILLESIISGNNEVYGSDISEDMIKSTKKNIDFIKDEFNTDLKTSEVIKLDAKDIANSPILNNNKIDSIVTEGYLGEIFGKHSIDIDKVKNQRLILANIYTSFFSGLKKVGFTGNIVISFPFWEIKGKYNYFEEIYDILNKYCQTQNLLPNGTSFTPSKSGSLLYKRPNQTVGREIFKLKIK